MKIIPPKIMGAPAESGIPELTLVIYENDGAPVLGAVRGTKKGKYLILSMRNREVELTRDRIHVIPSPRIAPFESSAEGAATLLSLFENAQTQARKIPLDEIWMAAREDRLEYSTQQLTELYYGNNDREHHLIVRLALLADPLFFKRIEIDRFAPRSQETVEELKKAEEAKIRRTAHEKEIAQWLAAPPASRGGPPPEGIREEISLLEQCAASSEEALPRVKEIDSLLSACEKVIGTALHGTREQKALSLLLRVGHFTPRSNLSIIRHGVEVEFLPEEIAVAKVVPPVHDFRGTSRRDLTELECYTIDDVSTLDMDDALSLETTAQGFILGIHVSDVTALIPPDSPLDEAARRRATSLYLADRTIPMLPIAFSEGAASLVEGEDRLALSVLITLDNQCRVVTHEITPSLIRSRGRLNYDAVDVALESESDERLSRLYRIAIDQETRRLEAGAIRVHKRDALVSVNESGGLTLTEVDETSPARLMVSEMMVWANSILATWAAAQKIPFIYRCQDPSDPNLSRTLAKLPQGPAYDFAIRTSLKRSETSDSPRRHASLGLDAYGQCTSPIRRYADLLVQRQVMGTLLGTGPVYTREQLAKIVASIEPRLGRSNVVSRESKRFWLLTYLRERPELMERIQGTVVRTDLKNPLVELDVVYITILVRSSQSVSPGDVVQVRINEIDPQRDLVRAEVIEAR